MRGTSSILLSKERVTQGDSLSLCYFTLLDSSLLLNPWATTTVDQPNQVWCVDDASVCGPIKSLIEWLIGIKEKGTKFGYFPKPSKSYLVVSENYISEAETVFSGDP